LYNDELALAILRNAETMRTQKSLASNLGYSVGKINYILKALISKGLIKVENFATSENKRHYKYLLTRDGIDTKINLTERFIEKKKREYEMLMVELDKMKESYVY